MRRAAERRGRRRLRATVALALGLGAVCLGGAGCRLVTTPEFPNAIAPPAPLPALEPADKNACPDRDFDGFSLRAGCGVRDCSDTLDFADPDTGWCAPRPALVCEPAGGWDAADFAIVRRDGLLHVVYIKGPLWLDYPATHGKSFGHESTLDGLSWQAHGDALAVNPASDWDRNFVWAPSIVFNPADGLYHMFYAGVVVDPATGWHTERIGSATSPDLETWTRVTGGGCAGVVGPGCVMDGDVAWGSWDEPGPWRRQCRDPFVIKDPASAHWYMVWSTAPGPYNGQGVIALARSDDLVHWTDLGPIACTLGTKAESGTLFLHDGRVHLMWTVASNGGIAHSSASGFEAGDWTAPVLIPGNGAVLQVAPEVLDMGGWFLLGWVQEVYRDLRFRYLQMAPDGRAFQRPIAPLDCAWVGADNVHPGAVEVDNGVDDNCNGLVDEGTGPCTDQDGDFYGAAPSIHCSVLRVDCDDTNPDIHPFADEICGNGIDDDCNGVIDDRDICSPRLPPPLRGIY